MALEKVPTPANQVPENIRVRHGVTFDSVTHRRVLPPASCWIVVAVQGYTAQKQPPGCWSAPRAGSTPQSPRTRMLDALPDLIPPNYGEIRDPSRPVLSHSWTASGPHRAAAHTHPRAHIIFPVSGVYWAITPDGTWLVPSGQAIWIPPDVPHEVYSLGPVSARILWVDPSCCGPLRHTSGTVKVSPLLTELVLRAANYGNDYPPDGAAARLARVMLDELAGLEMAPLLIPVSKEPRLARVMERLIEDPTTRANLEEVAKDSGASPRTLARLFRAETGMTFKDWKTRLILAFSIERLARGSSVTEVAFDFGYNSTSSFVYMFRSNLGVAPGRYARRDAPGTGTPAGTAESIEA